MDEHDPEFDPVSFPAPQASWGEFFLNLGKVALIVLALALFLAGLK